MSSDADLEELEHALRRVALWHVGLVSLAAVAALMAWLWGTGASIRFEATQVPSAPLTALIALLLAVSIGLRARDRRSASGQVSADRLAVAAFALAITALAYDVIGVDFPLERWLSRTTAIENGIQLGRISAFTAAAFAVLAAALSIGARPGGRRYESIGLSITLGAAIVLLQGYLLGAPLLYNGNFIPVAAPTGIAIALISVAGLLVNGPNTWPVRLFIPTDRVGVLPSRAPFVWFALLLAAIVVSSGYFWSIGEARRNNDRVSEALNTIVDLKARELAAWFDAQRGMMIALANVPVPAAELVRRADGRVGFAERAAVAHWLHDVHRANGFASVELFNSSRRLVLRGSADSLPASRTLASVLRDLPDSDAVYVHDIYRAADGHLKIAFVAPIATDPVRDRRPGAWLGVVLRVDATLSPLLREFPADYETGEFTLWRVDRDSVRVVSDVSRSKVLEFGSALPIGDSASMVAQWLRAEGGAVASYNVRGSLVRASALRVPGTQWYLAAKVDVKEIRAPVIRAAVRATVFSFLFLLSVAAGVYALWYRRDLVRARRELSLVEEREQSLADVRRSEERYARAMRGTSDGIWDVNLVTGEHFVSDQWREIVGVAADFQLKQESDLVALIDPSDHAVHIAGMMAALDDGDAYDVELRLRDATQGPRWIRSRAEVEHDADGRPVRMAGAVTDITRRRLAEQALRRADRVLRVRSAVNQEVVRAESEDSLLATICESVVREGGYRMAWIGLKEFDAAKSVRPVAIAGDEEGYLNEVAITWGAGESGQGPTGRCLSSGLPQVAQNLLTEPNYALWRSAAAARGYQSSLSLPLVVGGETVAALVLYAAEPNAFDTEEFALLSELGRDISFGIGALRSHLTLVAQGEQLTLFRQAIDNTGDAIYVADAATGRFVDFNKAAVQQLGYSPHEMMTIGPADIVPDFGARGGIGAFIAAIRAAGGLVRTSVHRRKDGFQVPVEVSLSIVDFGARTLLIGIARDLSDRVQALSEREELQAQLLRAQKMESVGRLAGGVAHDFNNLLTVINATADLAITELGEEGSATRDLKQIRAAGERAAGLTRQLLAFSRQQVLKREVLALNDVVTRCLAMVSRLIGEDVHVELKLGSHVPSIIADAGQLEQVLMNLCVNARDAMPSGGTLTIATSVADIDAEQAARREGTTAGTYATLTVTDTGVGMDKATLTKIFEPFFTTKEQGRGTGLGLSTVYGIVKQTGGTVWAYSEVGVGSTFRVYLPVTDQVAEEPTSGSVRKLETGKETILVVEDEDSIRFVARRVLERSGYTVMEANSGANALALLRTHGGALDLVMTDLVMPGMTGIELAAELHRTRPNLKILFTSGYSSDVVSDRFHPGDDWNFISKPYGVRELTAEIRRVLDS